ncbi:MAG TPA: phenylalanine--tRNA ligase subunit beta [Patescibacteria group bacterium]|nr:phenylalanine--tRNA ligase subunit beta [Patescibacteria group bacterium]
MNILISYDWLKEYVELKESPETFAARVSLSGPGIERLYPQGALLDKVVVGQINEIKPHPNAEKLRLATVNAGKKFTLVCGGSNLEVNQWVAVALVGAKVRWHGEGELIELAPAEIRGVKSEGMICGANEIGLFDAFPHAEREILDLGKAIPEAKWKPGMPLAQALGLSSDTVMDIEVTSNRPDAMSLVGLAREASAILSRPFLWKPAPKIRISPAAAAKSNFKIDVKDKKLCPRFTAVKIEGVSAGPSPWWMKRRLLSAGIRPINALVDITNYVMLELSEPMHVYDAEKLEGDRLVIRTAKPGESIQALDGKTYPLDESVLVVADVAKPVAVAGVMGGEITGVTSGTTSVVFEAATFDPVSVRRTARALNLYSDAQLRFEKGLSIEAPIYALARAVELCLELCGGSVSSFVQDSSKEKYVPKKERIRFDEISALMGVPVAKKQASDILTRLGFNVHSAGRVLTASVPWWRDHDIESGRDLVEEIARVFGYGQIPARFPPGLAHQPPSQMITWEERLKTLAVGAGLTEVYSYSFTSADLQRKAGFDPDRMLRVQNELSSDFVYMRTSLLPSLLQIVSENQERFHQQELFEIAHVYFHSEKTDLPDERSQFSAVYCGYDDGWKRAKGFAEHLFQEFGIRHVEWRRLEDDLFWHPGRTAQAFVNGFLLATVGELHPRIAEAFKFEGKVALIDSPLREIAALATTKKTYEPIPPFPEAKRDLAFTVNREIDVQQLTAAMKKMEPTLRQVDWFDTYKGEGIPADKKSVAFHLTFGSPDRTLETREVDASLEKMRALLKDQFGAMIRV